MKSSLDTLAHRIGIEEGYQDIWGKKHPTSAKTKEAILSALGVEADFTCPEIYVIEAGKPCETILNGQPTALPPLPIGYHHWPAGDEEALLIAAPPRCWLPPELEAGKRLWGVSTQLYGLRSTRNCGIGDFGDLMELAKGTARMGADVLGVNPLHASYPCNPHEYSPYSPSNREFLNYLYIDLSQLEGIGEIDAKALRHHSLIDYPAVARVKKAALERAYAHFRRHGNRDAFEAFKHQQGEALRRHAAFDALSEHFCGAGWYGEWPSPYQRPDSPEVVSFERQQAERMDFYYWLQFVADAQLASVQNAALEYGMLLGLYRDLAVGSGRSGAETWQHPHRFVRGVAVGAPPDSYNLKGQNWGLPPFNPLVMRQEKMQPFIDLLRANMRHAGALRIDHAFGLARLFWVPEGMEPTDGAYVTYPFDAMLAVLRVESHLNRCMVIGEDLGTFPSGYKEKAAASGVLSYRLLYFEREEDGSYIPPEHYPSRALTSISTHDLPTLAGWQEEWDIDIKAELDLYPSPEMETKDRMDREREQALLRRALDAQNLPPEMHSAVQRFLARSPAMLVMLQAEDVLSLREQVNIPATIDEHPNWRRKLPITVEQFCAPDGALAQLSEQVGRERGRSVPAHPLATYRLQLHKGFTFHDAAEIIPYLRKLGVSHVYTSPITQARAGSTHGYDVIDYARINPELGGDEGYETFRKALCQAGLRHILDFVPNHMGISYENAWWQDVLANGPDSPYAAFFDIDWQEKLFLPVLGKPYEEAMAAGEIGIAFDEKCNRYVLTYYDHRFAIHACHRAEAEQAMENPKILHKLIEKQCYRLGYWREAAQHINYRRFFEINDLAGVRIEDPMVFQTVHALLFSLFDKGYLDALRIDHIDGLADPRGYCHALQQRIGPNRYIVAEKILGEEEALPDWPIAGTSGYDVLNQINGLFIKQKNETAFTNIYQQFTGNSGDFAQVLQESKRQVLRESFGSELRALALEAARLGRQKWQTQELQHALTEIVACFPVYRSYITPSHADEQDWRHLDKALKSAGNNGISRQILAFIRNLFEQREENFLRHFQQLTGPAMAKGLEDTCFYRYHRFISLNEVGGNPGIFGLTITQFHALNISRIQNWPQNMIATATHDTKRGEDMRARLNALSCHPDAWEEAVANWHSHMNAAVDANDAYFLYQTLLGSWPLELLEEPLDPDALAEYRDRLCAYTVKALRECKQRSHWHRPDEHYEQTMQDAIGRLLNSPDFLSQFLPFARKLALAGMENSLCQTALKLTLPGVPDIYQGTEYWDFSLVDPDNRRPVDYTSRLKTLHRESWETLREQWRNGHIKQQLVATLLAHRRANRALYAYGEYIPVTVTGSHADETIAYLRQHENRAILVVAARFGSIERFEDVTAIAWPKEAPRQFRHLFTQETFGVINSIFPLHGLFPVLPVAVLESI